ncbi:MAG: hypothetical protein JWR80_4140 [Bradyrhizobium sp.]|nr:hypothetical protein [Bradyrhizobium sp.]
MSVRIITPILGRAGHIYMSYGLICCSGFLYPITSASAQVIPNPPLSTAKQSPDTDPEAGIQDIIVTARKRSENLRDVPVAVTAISGRQLTQLNVIQLADLVRTQPNFTVAYGAVQPFTFIRGFGTGNNLSFDQAVGKFVDNVSFGRDQDSRTPIFDVERIEILKGPQVLLFGNSTTAGAVNITTKKPTDHFAADISTSYEFESQHTEVQGGVSLPLAEWASLRVSGVFEGISKGKVFNTLLNRTEDTDRNYGARGIFRLTPASGLEILVKAEFDRTRQNGNTLEPFVQAASPIAAFPDVQLDGIRSVNNDVAPFFQKEYADTKGQVYQADVNYDVLGGKLTSTTAYRLFHAGTAITNGSPVPVFSATADQHYSQFSQELRYNGTFGKLQITGGGYYEKSILRAFTVQDFNVSNIGLPLPAFSRVATYDQRAHSWSLFTDLSYALTNSLSISVGGRYTDISKAADQTSNPANVVPNVTFDTPRSVALAALNPNVTGPFVAVTGSTPHNFVDLKKDENHFQPQVVLQYKFAANMIYAKFVRGDKAGGFDWLYGGTPTSATPSGAAFASEGARSFEVGAKGLILDRKLEFSFDAFSTTYSNLQVSVFQGSSFLVSNVGKARTNGVELELTWLPVHRLQVSAGGAYLDAKYLSFPAAACTIGQTLATPAGIVCRQDLSGVTTPFSSKWSGSISADYTAPVRSDYSLTVGLMGTARSSYNPSTNIDPLFRQGGYAQLDGHVDLASKDDRWTISFFVKNLTDKKVLEYGTPTPVVKGGGFGTLSRGRQLGVRLSARL